MDVVQWYSVGLVGFLVIVAILARIRDHRSAYWASILRILFIRRAPSLLQVSQQCSYHETVLILVLLLGNIAASATQVQSTSDLAQRTASIALVNLVPLALGGHMNIVLALTGLNLSDITYIHFWLGQIVVIQALLHTGSSFMHHESWKNDRLHISGLLVSRDSLQSTLLTIATGHVISHLRPVVITPLCQASFV